MHSQRNKLTSDTAQDPVRGDIKGRLVNENLNNRFANQSPPRPEQQASFLQPSQPDANRVQARTVPLAHSGPRRRHTALVVRLIEGTSSRSGPRCVRRRGRPLPTPRAGAGRSTDRLGRRCFSASVQARWSRASKRLNDQSDRISGGDDCVCSNGSPRAIAQSDLGFRGARPDRGALHSRGAVYAIAGCFTGDGYSGRPNRLEDVINKSADGH